MRIWLQEHGFQIVAESILEEAGKSFTRFWWWKLGQMKLSASDALWSFLVQRGQSSLCPKMAKEAVKARVCPRTNPRKNLKNVKF